MNSSNPFDQKVPDIAAFIVRIWKYTFTSKIIRSVCLGNGI